jgi:hypothetical protein
MAARPAARAATGAAAMPAPTETPAPNKKLFGVPVTAASAAGASLLVVVNYKFMRNQSVFPGIGEADLEFLDALRPCAPFTEIGFASVAIIVIKIDIGTTSDQFSGKKIVEYVGRR